MIFLQLCSLFFFKIKWQAANCRENFSNINKPQSKFFDHFCTGVPSQPCNQDVPVVFPEKIFYFLRQNKFLSHVGEEHFGILQIKRIVTGGRKTPFQQRAEERKPLKINTFSILFYLKKMQKKA